MALRIIPGESETMNHREKCILKSFETEICDSVDPVNLVSFLFRHNNVSKELKERVMFQFRTGSSRHDTMKVVLHALPELINISVLIYALDRTGYKNVAAKLFLVTRKSANNAEIQRHRSSSSADRTRLQTLYRNLKRMVHDSQFKNPREALRSMAKRFRSDFDVERDELKRQKLADKCVAILGVELDSHYYSVHSNVEITQQEILYEMKELISLTTNPLITDTIVYSRQANLDACHGEFHHAENMLTTARGSALGVEQCLELVNLLYVEVYVKLWEFEATPSREVLETLMMWGRIGLECLKNEHEETRRMWKRMFILRMVFGLLGLGNRGNIVEGYAVDNASIKEAQNLLADVDEIWDNIEVRREMLYCIARARLNEALDLFENAMEYLERAKLLAVQGGFLEKPFIEDFMNSIESKIGQTCSDLPESNSRLNLNRDEKINTRDLLWKSDTTSDSDDMVSLENLPPNSHNWRDRQFQRIVKEKEVKGEIYHDNEGLLHKGEMALMKYRHKSTDQRKSENSKETCHETIQNSSPTNLEKLEKQNNVEFTNDMELERVLGLFSTDLYVEYIDDTPASITGNSMVDDHSGMKSRTASKLKSLVKRKTFEGESGQDVAIPDIRDPDETDIKEMIQKSSDSTCLKNDGSERETCFRIVHSSAAVQLENEKEHAGEQHTSSKFVVESSQCFRVENGGSEDLSRERAKDDMRCQLTKACEEKLEFGSVVLYEDRLEPEGASFAEESKVGHGNQGTTKRGNQSTEDDFTLCDDDLFG